MIYHRIAAAVVTATVLIAQTAVLNVSAQAASDPDEIVKQVKKKLDRLETLTCEFTTEQVWKNPDRTQVIAGSLSMRVKEPFKLRLERPENVTVIDGSAVWTFLPKHNQVQISDYNQEKDEFPSPHNIFRQYSDKRKAVLLGEETVEGAPCDVLSLETSDPQAVKVTVWIDKKLMFPVKALEETTSGNTATHILRDIKLNVKLDNSVFTFKPPEGASVVDLR